MNIIVAVDESFGIGNGSKLLYNLPEDMAFFKEKTTGKIVVMGDVTLNSLPGGRPLKNRKNLIISADKDFSREGCTVFYDLESLLNFAKRFPTDDIFVIGGAYVYKQMLPFCKYAYITKIKENREANKFFPNIDKMDNWKMIEKSKEIKSGDICFNFCTYQNMDI